MTDQEEETLKKRVLWFANIMCVFATCLFFWMWIYLEFGRS